MALLVVQRLRKYPLKLGEFVGGVILITTFCYGLVIGGWLFFPIVLSSVTLEMVWQNAIILGLVVVCKIFVDKRAGILSWKLGLGLPLADHFQIPIYGLILWLIVTALMPAVVYAEEWMFREGSWLYFEPATNWFQWTQLAIVFGLLHLLNKIPVGYCLILIVVGLWLAYQYSLGGLEHAAAHHLVYNYINMLFALPTVLSSTLNLFKKNLT